MVAALRPGQVDGAFAFVLQATTRKDVTATIPRVKTERRLMTVLRVEEVGRLLDPTESAKYRAIFVAAYGAGSRIGEVQHLRIEDIDSTRGLIHVRYGKTGESTRAASCWMRAS